MNRITFGQEKHMIQLAPICADCDVQLGSAHLPGCHCEECPRCGRSLIYCRCGGAFSPSEEFIFITELASRFESRHHANSNVATGQDKGRMNLVESAAALRGLIERPDVIVGGVNPVGWSTPGEPVFSDQTLKDALGLTDHGVDFIRGAQLEWQRSPSDCWC